MPTNTSPEYTDVCRQDDPFPTWSFRSELVVYQEFLIRGQSVGRNWNGAGFMHPDSQRINTDNHPAAPTFAIELTGQLLNSHWMLTKETKLLATHGLHIVMDWPIPIVRSRSNCLLMMAPNFLHAGWRPSIQPISQFRSQLLLFGLAFCRN